LRARHWAPVVWAPPVAVAVVAASTLALLLTAGMTATGAAAETERTLSFYNIHTKETLTSTFKRGGKYVPEEMQKINWILRDWRRDEPTTMEPQLIDLLWEVHTELGSKEPIHIISGTARRTPTRCSGAQWADRRARAGTSWARPPMCTFRTSRSSCCAIRR
jgi:uncharacterized protein YcbK (DUF882 family)